MDAGRFDAFVRSIDILAPRRAALSGALGVGLTALLTHVGAENAHARKKRKKKCKGGKKKCGKKCIPKSQCCGCPAEACCDGTCVDFATDSAHCGACGHVCKTGACLNGACACANVNDCPEGCDFCSEREGGGKACSNALISEEPCVDDEDCPGLGSFCAPFLPTPLFFCTAPCLE